MEKYIIDLITEVLGTPSKLHAQGECLVCLTLIVALLLNF